MEQIKQKIEQAKEERKNYITGIDSTWYTFSESELMELLEMAIKETYRMKHEKRFLSFAFILQQFKEKMENLITNNHGKTLF